MSPTPFVITKDSYYDTDCADYNSTDSYTIETCFVIYSYIIKEVVPCTSRLYGASEPDEQ
jgi:hypothetical protein